MSDDLRVAVTVAEMARMVGLSRVRFYQLQKAGVFPAPKYDEIEKRPFYGEEAQKVCLEVRRRNFGVNGQVVLFYARRQQIAPARPKPKKDRAAPKKSPSNDIVVALKSLGLEVSAGEVEQAVKQLFGKQVSGRDQGEVIRAVFLHLKKRQDSGGNVGR